MWSFKDIFFTLLIAAAIVAGLGFFLSSSPRWHPPSQEVKEASVIAGGGSLTAIGETRHCKVYKFYPPDEASASPLYIVEAKSPQLSCGLNR